MINKLIQENWRKTAIVRSGVVCDLLHINRGENWIISDRRKQSEGEEDNLWRALICKPKKIVLFKIREVND